MSIQPSNNTPEPSNNPMMGFVAWWVILIIAGLIWAPLGIMWVIVSLFVYGSSKK